mmetsp:Transcript_42595/g.85269  ORF Transcript_42595/g.85269 Transcript_42595/m.85269 type:complete len:293 (-) Transcript_42595:289-1167(-)
MLRNGRTNPLLLRLAPKLLNRTLSCSQNFTARNPFPHSSSTVFQKGSGFGGQVSRTPTLKFAAHSRPLSADAEPAALKESPPEIRVQVLEAALGHVHQWGWTSQAIAAGATEQGLSAYAHGLFPRGAIELVEFFQQKCEKEWVEELAKVDTSGHTTQEKLSAALRMRLAKQGPYMSTWPQALALQALPHHAPGAMATLAKICDIAWTHAGDRRKDVTAYSKRAVLGGIYTGSELYMLTDYSEGFTDTYDFLDRQLREAQKIGTTMELVGQQAEQLMAQGLSSMQGHKDANRP